MCLFSIHVINDGVFMTGGNGTGTGNETEDEDHEFFDAVEEGVSAVMEDKTSFVIKVPVSIL